MTNSNTDAPHPIEQYAQLLQSKSNAAYVRTILLKALSDPRVYVGFSELRSLPTVVNALQESDSGKAMLDTLDLFSYGTYRQYTSMPEGKYISLAPTLLTKLKALTVVTIVQQQCDAEATKSVQPKSVESLGSKSAYRNRRGRVTIQSSPPNSSCRIIPYSLLQPELDMMQDLEVVADGGDRSKKKQSIRALEDLLIHCIYCNLLPPGTKLDQQKMSVVINLTSQSASPNASNSQSNHVLCRDVNVETDISGMINRLEVFFQKGEENILLLNKSLKKLNQDSVKEAEKWRKVNKSINEMKEKVEHNADRSNSAMRMITEGDTVGVAMGMSSLSSSERSRQVKRSRGGIGSGMGRI